MHNQLSLQCQDTDSLSERWHTDVQAGQIPLPTVGWGGDTLVRPSTNTKPDVHMYAPCISPSCPAVCAPGAGVELEFPSTSSYVAWGNFGVRFLFS